MLDLIKDKQKDMPPTLVAEVLQGMRKRTKTTDLFETIIKGLGDKGKRNDNLASFMGGLLMRNVDPYIAAQLAMIANTNSLDPLPINEVERTVNSMIEKENRRRGI